MMDAEIQWFIARDGKQHGPLSDVEMRKLVELNHLRSSDLIWRQGFPDWRPAASVFPMTVQAPQAPAPAAAPASAPRQAAAPSAGAPMRNPAGPTTARPAAGSGYKPLPPMSSSPVTTKPNDGWAESAARSSQPEKPKGRGRSFVVASIMLAAIGAVAWFGYQNRDWIVATSKKASEPLAKTATQEGPTAEKSAATLEATAAPTSSNDAVASLSESMQKRPIWSALKQEFPEWYDERVKEAAKLKSEGKSELEVMQHLIDALVTLRRQNANSALAASAIKHRELATAFRDNLKKLAQENAETCYAFISRGEASPDAVALMLDIQKSATLEAQVVAIVSAISEGRKSPATHQAPGKADYDALAAELNRLGWTQADMQLFADPNALARAPHDRVCQMVQDWFTAHLAIQDAGIQERLLFETLKPVISG